MGFFKKLFLFIQCKIWDYRNPQEYRPYGIRCYVGLPGTGKTLSLVEQLIVAKSVYPKIKIYTNFGFIHEDGPLKSWQDLVDLENGNDGIIFALDEVHTMFGRKDWQSIPPAILQVFSQNRKMAKQFLCTAQSYADIVVDLRRRCEYIIECNSFMTRWVIQRAFTASNYQSDHDTERTYRKRAFRHSFIATNEIYNSYDTYAVIESLRSSSDDGNFQSSLEKTHNPAPLKFKVRRIASGTIEF